MTYYDLSTQQPVGYTWLVEAYQLKTRPHWRQSFIKSNVQSRETLNRADHVQHNFRQSYAPENTILGHLEFALRYEGINLEILSRLFIQDGKTQLETALQKSTRTPILRRFSFLYEGLTNTQLNVPDTNKKRAICNLGLESFHSNSSSFLHQKPSSGWISLFSRGSPDYSPGWNFCICHTVLIQITTFRLLQQGRNVWPILHLAAPSTNTAAYLARLF